MTLLKDQALKWWFVVSSIGIAILYIVMDRKNRNLNEALRAAQTQILTNKLIGIKEKADVSDSSFKEATTDYETLKRLHGALLHDLGIGVNLERPDSKTD